MTNPLRPTLLFQDKDILVINKPAHLLSIPDGYDPNLPHIKSFLEPELGRLWMVHRLDKETSGVMILARDADAHRTLNAAFKSHALHKTYHGLVAPIPDWREKTIDTPLAVNADRRHRTRADARNGKPAWSRCQVLKWFSQGALLSIKIRTGVTHQIRAHLRSCDLALLGDTLYQAGLEEPAMSAPRVMLHAREIDFSHPITGETLHFTAPYPNDFRELYTLLVVTTNQENAI